MNEPQPNPDPEADAGSNAADGAAQEEALGAQIDTLLDQMQSSVETLEPEAAPAPDAPASDEESDAALEASDELGASIDAALADAQEKLEDAVNAGQPPSIEQLDEALADSTPTDEELDAADEPSPAGFADSSFLSSLAEDIATSDEEATETEEIAQAGAEAELEAAGAQVEETGAEPEADSQDANEPEASDESAESHEDASLTEDGSSPERTEDEEAEGSIVEVIGPDATDTVETLVRASLGARVAQAALVAPRVLAQPLRLVSPDVRDVVAWAALVTAFNAGCIWMYILFLRG